MTIWCFNGKKYLFFIIPLKDIMKINKFKKKLRQKMLLNDLEKLFFNYLISWHAYLHKLWVSEIYSSIWFYQFHLFVSMRDSFGLAIFHWCLPKASTTNGNELRNQSWELSPQTSMITKFGIPFDTSLTTITILSIIFGTALTVSEINVTLIL